MAADDASETGGRYRETLVLFYFHEMNVASAAQRLALPEGTVKARLSPGDRCCEESCRRRCAIALLEDRMISDDELDRILVGALSAAFVGEPSLTDATAAVPSLDLPQALPFASNALNSNGAAWIGLALLVTVRAAQLSPRAAVASRCKTSKIVIGGARPSIPVYQTRLAILTAAPSRILRGALRPC
jgi:hypothetical protein